ncbi:hypothetical protein Vadar_006553 [Vaccinium darrowii]|uniref:Uncharacterized protein n=1 Tax=Vaccinium darrowii TaxID=229202 RepID=A0ACB7Z2C0_9ERIC|nr:hypothetical protein Vadar_006553 [Vaccinium darrowii]
MKSSSFAYEDMEVHVILGNTIIWLGPTGSKRYNIQDSNKDLSYLTNLPNASEKLQIFNADLAQPESFTPACLDSRTVKRVVYTSGASTVVFNEKREGVLDESDWSDVDYIRSLKIFGASYMISKTLTEKAALKFAEKHGLDLVTVIPTSSMDPSFAPGCLVRYAL